MVRIADYLMQSISISKRIQEKSGKMLKDFVLHLADDEEIKEIAGKVRAWALTFSMPGV